MVANGRGKDFVERFTNRVRYQSLRALLALISGGRIVGRILRRASIPLYHFSQRGTRFVFLGTILNAYFIALKIRKRVRTLAVSGRHRIIAWLNRYVYRMTIGIIIISTILFNLFGKTLSAEELSSKLLLASMLGGENESVVQIIEEGPLTDTGTNPAVSYLDKETVLTDDYISGPGGTDSDDEDVYATTEGESAIIAPIITDPNAITPQRRDSIEIYIVQSGDTIGSIAQQFGISASTILWQNNLGWNSTIRPGQSISILPVSGVAHTVKSGDTVSSIAKRYQVDSPTIIEFNKLADAADIRAGETLIVPNGIKPTVIAARPVQTRALPEVLKDIFVPSSYTGGETGSRFLWPLLSNRITQYFRLRHTGVDVGDKTGKPIYAAESGKVERAGWNSGGYGYHVIINHGNGVQTLYAHASRILVKAGDVVTRGQTIALIGSTGRSSGPHLHFEVRVNGRAVNPLNYIR